MMDIVLSVACKVAAYLVAPVGRRCGYVIFTNSYVGQLKEELEKLDHARQRVQRSLDDAENNMREISGEVNGWKINAETVANKARGLLDDDGRAKKTCFCGWLPNPKERYCLGREARKTFQAIRALIPQREFGPVYYESAPPGRVAGAPDVNSSVDDGGDTITDSRASIFRDIMKALDDEKLKVIGVYGLGGVGKTTLLEEVEKKLRKAGRPFHMIVKAKVSQNPDLKNIQDQIADALKLDLNDLQSEGGRGNHLLKRLQKDPSEKVLIILDDLWEKLDLKAAGIPSGDVSGKCKLLLTSRYKDVLEQNMAADQTFFLEGLKDDEALRLFEKTVGDKLKDDEELKAKAAQVVAKLAGLPLLITSVARTLKCSDVSTWENALIKIEDPNIEKIVKLNYDHLEKEDAKSLFLLCRLIGGTIQVELLLGLGMGLGLFEVFNKTIQSSRNRLNEMLDCLRSVCLLQDGGDDKENVTIHDLYSEVVISTPFRGQNSLMMNNSCGPWPKEKLEKCWAICLTDVGNDRLAELMTCHFPDLKILMLSQPKDWRHMPEHRHDVRDFWGLLDFTYMKELRALCLCSMGITSLPSSMEILGSLQSLYLYRCDVKDVAILGKLKALQILSFAGSVIYRLPKEIGELTNLKLLNLSKCHYLKTIEPGVLKCLINLEELRMKNSFHGWMGENKIPSESCNVRLSELKSLIKLTTLEVSIPDPTILLEDGDLPFGNLIRFWINIGNVTYSREFEGLRTMKLKLEGCNSILSKEWVQKTLQKTEYLHLIGLTEFKKSAHELCTQGFLELKHLYIEDSPSVKYIANSSSGLPLIAFTKLESLFLNNLINMEKICHGPIAPECFSKLKAVSVRKCDQLKYLWYLSDMQRLVQLGEIEVRECDSMQAIVTDDAGEDIVSADDIIGLPNVCRLVFNNLPNMTRFYRAKIRLENTPIQVSLPRLESLEMGGLLDLEEILYSQPPLTDSNLKSLCIQESQSTSNIMNSDWMLKLPNLESLTILDCRSAEVVFNLGELKVTRDVKSLSLLTELRLIGLSNLQRIWKQDVQLQEISRFRKLEKLYVGDTGLVFLFPLSVAKCLREIRDIKVARCRNMKAVIVDDEGRDGGTNDIIEFPLLKRLSISDCPIEKFFSYSHGKKEPVTPTPDSQDAYSNSFFDQKVSLPHLEELKLDSVRSLKRIWHGELPRSSFSKLATLVLYYCRDLLDVFPSTIIKRLQNLNHVDVELCPSLESLFDCGSLDSNTKEKIVFLPKLEYVALRKVRRLTKIMTSDSEMVLGFPNLKEAIVYKCFHLRYLFPYSTAKTLEKLKSLLITLCTDMKEVVAKEESGQSKAEVMSFPCLSSLRLLELDYLISFSSGSYSYDFASLELIDIERCPYFGGFIPSPKSVKRPLGEMAEEDDESPQPWFNEVTCPNLRHLRIEVAQCKELWNNQIPIDSFCKLESLKLKYCDNLMRIAPSHMWKRLQCHLKILEVVSCPLIETIYESDGMFTENDKLTTLVLDDLKNLRHFCQYDGLPDGTAIIFSELTTLRLFDLPKFRGFLPEKYYVEFPSLEVDSRVRCGTEPEQDYDDWVRYDRRKHRSPYESDSPCESD